MFSHFVWSGFVLAVWWRFWSYEREEEEEEEERDREGGLRPAAFRFTARGADVIGTSDITVLEFQKFHF